MCFKCCPNNGTLSCFGTFVIIKEAQAKDYKNSICCFSAKRTVLRSESKDWLARNQDNVSECMICIFMDCCFSEVELYKTRNVTYSHHALTNKMLTQLLDMNVSHVIKQLQYLFNFQVSFLSVKLSSMGNTNKFEIQYL